MPPVLGSTSLRLIDSSRGFLLLVSALRCDFREQPENGPGPVPKFERKDLDLGS